MAMNPTIKARWITALRSGKYIQGRGALTTVTKNEKRKRRDCCLGVLCDLAVRAGVIPAPVPELLSEKLRYDNRKDILPSSVVQWAGLDSHDPHVRARVGGYTTGHWLSDLNDAHRRTFAQIARYIEASL